MEEPNYELLEEKKQAYLRCRSQLSQGAIQRLDFAFEVEYTHNSTAIEGNTLSLLETKLLMEDQISVGGKALREIYEVVNHQKAFHFVQEKIAQETPLTEEVVKEIHAIVNENIFVGGVYRNEPVRIGGASHEPPSGQEMFHQIKDFFYDLEACSLSAVEKAAWCHNEFVRIHPFVDGNGRTARLMMNYLLMEGAYPPISIPVDQRFAYYEALDCYGKAGDQKPFALFLEKLLLQRLEEFEELLS